MPRSINSQKQLMLYSHRYADSIGVTANEAYRKVKHGNELDDGYEMIGNYQRGVYSIVTSSSHPNQSQQTLAPSGAESVYETVS